MAAHRALTPIPWNVDLPAELLDNIYDSILGNAISLREDDDKRAKVRRGEGGGGGGNPATVGGSVLASGAHSITMSPALGSLSVPGDEIDRIHTHTHTQPLSLLRWRA